MRDLLDYITYIVYIGDNVYRRVRKWLFVVHNDEIIINKVSFNDVESVFSIVWYEGHELYWYQKVWSILENKGLTTYSSQFEYAAVIIRAITLSILYEEFCQLAFDEHCEYDGYWDAVYNMIPDVVIGQLYAKLAEADYTEDMNYALCMIADGERKSVFTPFGLF